MTEAEILHQVIQKQNVLYDNLWLSNLLLVIGVTMGAVILWSLSMIYRLKVTQYKLSLEAIVLLKEIRETQRRRGDD